MVYSTTGVIYIIAFIINPCNALHESEVFCQTTQWASLLIQALAEFSGTTDSG